MPLAPVLSPGTLDRGTERPVGALAADIEMSWSSPSAPLLEKYRYVTPSASKTDGLNSLAREVGAGARRRAAEIDGGEPALHRVLARPVDVAGAARPGPAASGDEVEAVRRKRRRAEVRGRRVDRRGEVNRGAPRRVDRRPADLPDVVRVRRAADGAGPGGREEQGEAVEGLDRAAVGLWAVDARLEDGRAPGPELAGGARAGGGQREGGRDREGHEPAWRGGIPEHRWVSIRFRGLGRVRWRHQPYRDRETRPSSFFGGRCSAPLPDVPDGTRQRPDPAVHCGP